MAAAQFVVFVHLKASLSWLQLSRAERRRISESELGPIFARYPQIVHQHFDAEAFTVRVSDIEMIFAPNAQVFYDFYEEFRDSQLIAHGYFEVIDIFATFADGYKAFEASTGKA